MGVVVLIQNKTYYSWAKMGAGNLLGEIANDIFSRWSQISGPSVTSILNADVKVLNHIILIPFMDIARRNIVWLNNFDLLDFKVFGFLLTACFSFQFSCQGLKA